MTRILAILLILLVILIAVQRGLAALRSSPLGRTLTGAWQILGGMQPPPATPSARTRGVRDERGPVRLVACRHCGVHVPESEVSRTQPLCDRCRS